MKEEDGWVSIMFILIFKFVLVLELVIEYVLVYQFAISNIKERLELRWLWTRGKREM